MGWSKLYSTLYRHRKTYDLAKLLGRDHLTAIGLIVSVWNVAVDFEPDGDFSAWTDDQLNRAIGWKGRRVGSKSALTQAGLLDDSGVLHDWPETMGSYKQAERKRLQRKRTKRRGTVPGQ